MDIDTDTIMVLADSVDMVDLVIIHGFQLYGFYYYSDLVDSAVAGSVKKLAN